jgi:hypothetical protein
MMRREVGLGGVGSEVVLEGRRVESLDGHVGGVG